MTKLWMIPCILPAALLAQPASVLSGGVQNAAAAILGLRSAGIAPGSWFAVQGRNLGPAEIQRSSTPSGSLGGTSVKISAGGAKFDVSLISVQNNQIIGRVPMEVPAGDAVLSIETAAGAVDEAARFTVVASNFGMFTADMNDSGDVVWNTFASGGTFLLNGLDKPSKPGDEVNLWGTGIGSGDAAIEVFVNGKSAEIVAKVMGENGIDRVRIRIPGGGEGCGVPVSMKSGGALANVVGLLSVSSDGGVCLDQNGFTAADIEKAKANGGLNAGYLFLTRYGFGGTSFDLGFANFSRISYDAMRAFRSNWAQTLPGACYAVNTDGSGSSIGQGQPDGEFFDDFYPFGETPLDAGPVVNISGPGGPQQMQQVGPGSYTNTFFNFMNPLVSYFTPGDYTFSGSGGEVGGFSATVRIGSPVVWQNTELTQTIDRDKDMTLSWTGGAPNDRVWVQAFSSSFDASGGGAVGIVSCYERAERGSITIPASVLQFLPVNSQEGASALFLYSLAEPKRFQPSGGGLDAGYVVSLSYSIAPATVR